MYRPLVALIWISFFATPLLAKPQLLASGKLELAKGLEAKAKGIRTVFLVVYDPASKRPMPYGAQKVMLSKDAAGAFVSFEITTESLRTMAAGSSSLPKTLRLKARLDKDGSAGMDQPGDIVGSVEPVSLGDKNVHITLGELK